MTIRACFGCYSVLYLVADFCIVLLLSLYCIAIVIVLYYHCYCIVIVLLDTSCFLFTSLLTDSIQYSKPLQYGDKVYKI